MTGLNPRQAPVFGREGRKLWRFLQEEDAERPMKETGQLLHLPHGWLPFSLLPGLNAFRLDLHSTGDPIRGNAALLARPRKKPGIDRNCLTD